MQVQYKQRPETFSSRSQASPGGHKRILCYGHRVVCNSLSVCKGNSALGPKLNRMQLQLLYEYACQRGAMIKSQMPKAALRTSSQTSFLSSLLYRKLYKPSRRSNPICKFPCGVAPSLRSYMKLLFGSVPLKPCFHKIKALQIASALPPISPTTGRIWISSLPQFRSRIAFQAPQTGRSNMKGHVRCPARPKNNHLLS